MNSRLLRLAQLEPQFNELSRGVGIEGVAEFTPKADSKPFQVLAANVMFTAPAGNEVFAIRHYKDEEYVIARVEEGTVVASRAIMIEGSQSGETVDTLAAMEEARVQSVRSIALVNAVGSQAAHALGLSLVCALTEQDLGQRVHE